MKVKKLAISILIPVLLGVAAAVISRSGMEDFNFLTKPPLSPPPILFPIVWTVLYTLMGISAYRIHEKAPKSSALAVYGLQLAFNFFWSLIFFNANRYLFAFVWLVALWLLIIVMIVKFYKIDKVSAYLQIPYLLWVTFAGYLNYAIYVLN